MAGGVDCELVFWLECPVSMRKRSLGCVGFGKGCEIPHDYNEFFGIFLVRSLVYSQVSGTTCTMTMNVLFEMLYIDL